MRSRRIYGGESAVYHCVTRVVNGEMLFGGKEKEMLRRMLRRAAEFSGVELLTYAVMSNHLHVLVRVDAGAKGVGDAELLRRYRVLYPEPTKHEAADIRVLEQMLESNSEEGQRLRARLVARMGDLSEFMKTLIQRYTIWFNKSHGRYGPLWCDRFKSTVIEDMPEVLRTVGAYIDLNPVRAGLVADPKDYRWCGYAEAVAGDKVCAAGVGSLTRESTLKGALAVYRVFLFGKGAAPKGDGSGGRISPEAARSVMENQGDLDVSELLRQRLKHLSMGAVLGSALFVEQFIETWSGKIGDRRKRKPKRVGQAGECELATFRHNRSTSEKG